MTNTERLYQIVEASKARELTEEEKADLVEVMQPIVDAAMEAFKSLAEAFGKLQKALVRGINLGLLESQVLPKCPNKRVVHLAKHGRKWRTRKKNLHRAARIVKKEATK